MARTREEIIAGLQAWSHDERLGDGMLLREAAAALRRGTCGTCKHDGCCGIQAVCVSSVHTDKRATGCTGAYEPKAPTEPTR